MQEFLTFIETLKNENVHIQTHNFPDPDAIGSAYGLKKLLAYYGIEADICYEGMIDTLSSRKITDVLGIEMKSHKEIQEELSENDVIICVDSQKNGGNIKDFVGEEVASIDHHPTYVEVEYQYKDIRKVGACATIITDYYEKLGVPMSKNVATALLYGIKMDTLQFSRGVTLEDIHAYEYLFTRVDNQMLARLESNTMEADDLRAYGEAIENIKIHQAVGFAALHFPCPDALIAKVSDFILSLEEVEVAVIYSYRDAGIKFSVRSEIAHTKAGEVAHNAIGDLGNGGGHDAMAGGFIPKENMDKLGAYPDDTITEMFLREINK